MILAKQNIKKEAKAISTQSRWRCCGNVLHHWNWITSLWRELARWHQPRFSTRSTQHFIANGCITLRLIRMQLLLIRPIISFNSLHGADSLLLVAITERREIRRVGGLKGWTCWSHLYACLTNLSLGFSPQFYTLKANVCVYYKLRFSYFHWVYFFFSFVIQPSPGHHHLAM